MVLVWVMILQTFQQYIHMHIDTEGYQLLPNLNTLPETLKSKIKRIGSIY